MTVMFATLLSLPRLRARVARVARRVGAVLIATNLLAVPAFAQEPISFKGKMISIIVGSAPGGGTDASGRLVAPFLTKYLPGNPAVVVRNVPGADGVVALNHFVQQTKPDGLTLMTAGGPDIDPRHFRAPQSHYDPMKFEYVGGIGRGGTMIVINTAAETRLHDKRAAPVTMGVAGPIPRTGEVMAAWGIGLLGWNAKWIVGYGGTNALILALQQGEIDMAATANTFALNGPIATGKIKVLVQSGALQNGETVPRPEFASVPLISSAVAGKLDDSIAAKSFAYWRAVTMVDKFYALPPGTPVSFVELYRNVYRQIAADPEFTLRGRKMSEVFAPMSERDVTSLVEAVAATPLEAVGYLDAMLKRQGLNGL